MKENVSGCFFLNTVHIVYLPEFIRYYLINIANLLVIDE